MLGGNMRDLVNDFKVFLQFFSFGFLKATIRQPLMSIGMFFLWAAGLLRDISKVGLDEDCDR